MLFASLVAFWRFASVRALSRTFVWATPFWLHILGCGAENLCTPSFINTSLTGTSFFNSWFLALKVFLATIDNLAAGRKAVNHRQKTVLDSLK